MRPKTGAKEIMDKQALSIKAHELISEIKELERKMQWQAGCMANDGASSAEIDAATATKMARYQRIVAERREVMIALFA